MSNSTKFFYHVNIMSGLSINIAISTAQGIEITIRITIGTVNNDEVEI